MRKPPAAKPRSLGPYWNIYRDIKQRLFNPTNRSYRRQHGLKLDFLTYRDFEHYIDSELGPPPRSDSQITRIDLKKGYVWGNLQWSNRRQISRRAATITKIRYQGRQYCMSEFCELEQLPYWRFRRALKEYGMTVREAIKYARQA